MTALHRHHMRTLIQTTCTKRKRNSSTRWMLAEILHAMHPWHTLYSLVTSNYTRIREQHENSWKCLHATMLRYSAKIHAYSCCRCSRWMVPCKCHTIKPSYKMVWKRVKRYHSINGSVRCATVYRTQKNGLLPMKQMVCIILYLDLVDDICKIANRTKNWHVDRFHFYSDRFFFSLHFRFIRILCG